MRLYNKTTNALIGERICMADTFLARARGLLGKKELKPGEGLILFPCRGIHSIGMKFPFDAVFLDAKRNVVHLASQVMPFRIIPYVRDSRYVVELPAGSIVRHNIRIKHRLHWCE